MPWQSVCFLVAISEEIQMMMRALAVVAAAALLPAAAFSQAAEHPQFEAADVHVAPQTTNRFARGGTIHGARYELHNASMLDLITRAYGIDDDKVLGGPSWLEMDRFDLIAKVPAGTTPDNLKLMLQSLLADRFNLTIHQDTKPFPAFSLTVGKRLLIKPSEGTGAPSCATDIKAPPQPISDGGPVPITFNFTCHNETMAAFAEEIRFMPQPRPNSGNSRPIVDQTELKGAWNIEFSYTLNAGPGALPTPISDVLEKQLGLKLEAATLALPIIEVKSANQTPTPNSPEAMKLFPPLPTEFDVAEVKPSAPSDNNSPAMMVMGGGMMVVARGGGGGGGGRGGGSPVLQNGRLNLQGMPLKSLIMLAWDLPSEDYLLGIQKWMETDRFDVIGKVPAGPVADAFTDMDAMKPLLRALLLDKFKLSVHTEEKPVNGFVLLAVKPKPKKADPGGRTKWSEGPPQDTKDPRIANPALSRLVNCENMTMAQFATLLPNMAGGYVRTPVLDETGLEGAWDFTVNFSPAGLVNGGGRGGRGGGGEPGNDSASDPSGGLSLQDAIQKQLGLKLDTQKRPRPVLVIDHADSKPIEN
jgi:uncharacterized protein (TIGR03435 family)